MCVTASRWSGPGFAPGRLEAAQDRLHHVALQLAGQQILLGGNAERLGRIEGEVAGQFDRLPGDKRGAPGIDDVELDVIADRVLDRKSTRLNSSHRT